jgi:hypothetical protein
MGKGRRCQVEGSGSPERLGEKSVSVGVDVAAQCFRIGSVRPLPSAAVKSFAVWRTEDGSHNFLAIRRVDLFQRSDSVAPDLSTDGDLQMTLS